MVTLSSPDKVLWPAAGLTKQDLYDYVLDAADRLLPQLADRPLSVKRFPRGVEATGFFVKDTPDHAPPAIGRWREWAHSADREVAYSLVSDREGLAWMSQQNTIEFHPALLRIDRPDRADQLVFDVDPGQREVPPARVARWIRGVLQELGLEPIVKTSGGRGVHVIVPIERRYGPDLLRPLTLAIARLVVEQHPDELTVEMRKDQRGGRTLVDWSRGGSSTLIAAWSPRAHPAATVATPLSWDEVTDDLDPTRFVMPSVLERDDPWAEQPRPARLERVVRAVEDRGVTLVDASPRGRTSSYLDQDGAVPSAPAAADGA
ncbi:non-homologous end-joining DNA ligase [Euzebya tangerina]|uniref:non-homologous end-joining DNA ligase n=1 Tax=Euzebya tangerina TaxID=591198 RepID=UPI000E315037|nr:non-homologous end-joining DNA ligase [Euzebya tangerina]